MKRKHCSDEQFLGCVHKHDLRTDCRQNRTEGIHLCCKVSQDEKSARRKRCQATRNVS